MLAEMPLPLYQVDAFTHSPFSGNPAAVCMLDQPADAQWMQHVAAEMNLAETAFLDPAADGFHLRWFTPTVEVDLCGHATLASAHVLWETNRLDRAMPARFHTRSGLLTCALKGDWIEMDFPSQPAEKVEAPPRLLDALGLAGATVARSRSMYLVEMESEMMLRRLVPDFARLKPVECVGVIVTARTPGEFDFISRFFAPQSGIDEDPVTGSAHCVLAPWWASRLGRPKMTAFQASRRGGVVRVEWKGDRVILGGQAVTTMRGEWLA